MARTIIQENKFRQTGFNQIHLKDLEDILVKEKSATVYIDEEACPDCERIFPKLELYLYKIIYVCCHIAPQKIDIII